MGYPYPQRQQFPDNKIDSAFWNYPAEEYLKSAGDRSYIIKDYEKNNLESIRSRVSGKIAAKSELFDYLSYLDNFAYKLREILELEKLEGISNIRLESELRRIAQLIGEVTTNLERF
jgi:hypothetical protein